MSGSVPSPNFPGNFHRAVKINNNKIWSEWRKRMLGSLSVLLLVAPEVWGWLCTFKEEETLHDLEIQLIDSLRAPVTVMGGGQCQGKGTVARRPRCQLTVKSTSRLKYENNRSLSRISEIVPFHSGPVTTGSHPHAVHERVLPGLGVMKRVWTFRSLSSARCWKVCPWTGTQMNCQHIFVQIAWSEIVFPSVKPHKGFLWNVRRYIRALSQMCDVRWQSITACVWERHWRVYSSYSVPSTSWMSFIWPLFRTN